MAMIRRQHLNQKYRHDKQHAMLLSCDCVESAVYKSWTRAFMFCKAMRKRKD